MQYLECIIKRRILTPPPPKTSQHPIFHGLYLHYRQLRKTTYFPGFTNGVAVSVGFEAMNRPAVLPAVEWSGAYL